jgi:hypothetical protein
MNPAQLREKLIAAAKANPPGDTVPYAFEKRILARLNRRPATDEWAQWVRSLWYGAAACSLIALGMGLWAYAPDDDVELAMDFSQTIEQTILPDDAAE